MSNGYLDEASNIPRNVLAFRSRPLVLYDLPMPVKALGREAVALLGYVSVAIVFAWPLPMRMAEAMIGLPGGDAGVYVWNLWVFRHEIVENHRLPFMTS